MIRTLLFLGFLGLVQVTAVQAEPTVIGRIESVKITPGDLVLRAKIDTGADHGSLSAEDLEMFERNAEQWVRFKIRNREGEFRTLETRVTKNVKIKREGGRIEKRPEIRMGICLGSLYMLVTINLTDRSDYAYPMLIGRDVITGHFIVDPSRGFTAKPSCVIPGDDKKKKKNKKSPGSHQESGLMTDETQH